MWEVQWFNGWYHPIHSQDLPRNMAVASSTIWLPPEVWHHTITPETVDITRNHGRYRQFHSKVELLRRHNCWHQFCWHNPLRYTSKDTTHLVNLYRGVVPPIDRSEVCWHHQKPSTLQPDYRRFYRKFKVKRVWPVTPTSIKSDWSQTFQKSKFGS